MVLRSPLNGLLVVAMLLGHASVGTSDDDPPVVLDPRLELTLFAADPDIVTPIGVAVDRDGQVFVVESHTHMPNTDYPGPEFDRIKVFEDTNGDGKADRVEIFADGFKDAMNLAFAPDGTLYVCHRTGVVALHDQDGDGVSDREEQETILSLETEQTYSHSCMLGLTFGLDGWLYVSRGNVGGYPYTIHGSDGSKVSGYGDGGNIVRCRPDGSEVQHYATGFWNPFDLKFDRFGRLLCVDNDPDSRGPNRLVHIIQGGDYGFKSLYGGSGLHPYNAWDGELPDTLPIMAGTEEAPSGVLDADLAALPEDFRGHLLVTSWGGHVIERFAPRPQGVSLTAERDFLVRGGLEFRPVGIDAGPDGSIYITDWVKRDYPNHGKGRIWKLSVKSNVDMNPPRKRFADPDPDEGMSALAQLLEAQAPDDFEMLLDASKSDDPFVRSAAVLSLARTASQEDLLRALEHEKAEIRLTGLLALRRSGFEPSKPQGRALLCDPDERIRRLALIWIGEHGLAFSAEDLKQALTTGDLTSDLMRIYLATVGVLTPEEQQAEREEVPGFRIQRTPRSEVIDELVRDDSNPTPLRALALALVERPERTEIFKPIARLALDGPPDLRLEAARTLSQSADWKAGQILIEIARDLEAPAVLRAEALVGIARQDAETIRGVSELLNDPEPSVRIEAARAARMAVEDASVRDVLSATLDALRESEGDPGLLEQLQFALNPAEGEEDRPSSFDEWKAVLSKGGDPEAGRRVFFHPSVACSTCHRVQGRGEGIGPDLSTIGQSSNRDALIHSILEPSAEIAPEFQAYLVATEDGQIFNGIQFHFRGTQDATMILEDGLEVRFRLDDLSEYKASDQSLMPEGLEEQMTVGDFRNLLAFLRSLK